MLRIQRRLPALFAVAKLYEYSLVLHSVHRQTPAKRQAKFYRDT